MLKLQSGIDAIGKERVEQLMKHNITVIDDVEKNDNGQLVDAAMYLLSHDRNFYPTNWSEETRVKLDSKSHKEKLAVAGAFLAAEIDRHTYVENE